MATPTITNYRELQAHKLPALFYDRDGLPHWNGTVDKYSEWRERVEIYFESAIDKDAEFQERKRRALVVSLKGLLEGEEDEDNPLARESIQLLADYRQSADPVLKQIEAGSYDNARVADRMLARPREHRRRREHRPRRRPERRECWSRPWTTPRA